MKWVWIAQIKCLNNHCIIAAVDEYGVEIEQALPLAQRVMDEFDRLVKEGVAKRACSICGETVFATQLARTGYHSLEEAKPALMESHRRQLATARFFRENRN